MALDVELAEIRDFLAGCPPFDELPPGTVEEVVPRLTVRYFRRGSAIIARGSDNHHLYVLRSGAADVIDEEGQLVDRGEPGTCFGSITLVQGNPSTFEVTAIEDSLVLAMDRATFHEIAVAHPPFARFFDLQRAARMSGAVASQQLSSTGGAILKTQVRDILRHAPVVVDGSAAIGEAARIMAEHRVSSLLVLDPTEPDTLTGIVTDRDLRTRVLAAGLDPALPVAQIMTPDPVTGTIDALAFEVLLDMVGRNIHHLPILENGRPVGVITTTDLMRLEHANPVYLAGDIAKQPDVAGVATVARRLTSVVDSLVTQDASAEDMGRVVTAIGDAVVRRILQLTEDELGPPPVPYCWVTLGSRARHEQALAADQDTALILDDSFGRPPGSDPKDDPDPVLEGAHAAYFTAFADRATAALEECGCPRCPGDVMATNPRWRQPLSQWRAEFRGWLKEPTPEAVLRASIFFDMRPVFGDATLQAALAKFVRKNAPKSPVFLAHLAKQASLNEPPLGFFKGFVLAKEGEHKDTLDIKRGGIGAVVELARVHALSLGVDAVSTHARISAAIHAGVVGAEKGQDLLDAFEFISYIRVRHQAAQVRAGREPDNHVAPDALSSFDKRHLREAFAIVRSAQSAMASRYPMQYIS